MTLTTHRMLNGGWALCAIPDTCELLFHFPDVTPEQMALVPERVLWDLCEVADPAETVTEVGDRLWLRPAGFDRGYDLPALIMADGRVEWWSEAWRHRDDYKPAVFMPDGNVQWWCHGQRTHELLPGNTTITYYSPFYEHDHAHSADQARELTFATTGD